MFDTGLIVIKNVFVRQCDLLYPDAEYESNSIRRILLNSGFIWRLVVLSIFYVSVLLLFSV